MHARVGFVPKLKTHKNRGTTPHVVAVRPLLNTGTGHDRGCAPFQTRRQSTHGLSSSRFLRSPGSTCWVGVPPPQHRAGRQHLLRTRARAVGETVGDAPHGAARPDLHRPPGLLVGPADLQLLPEGEFGFWIRMQNAECRMQCAGGLPRESLYSGREV